MTRRRPARARSVQAEFAVDRAQFRRTDQARMGDHDGVDRPLERLLPEREKFLQRGEIREEIVVLPDIGLQEPKVIGTAVKDARCGEALPFQLTPNVLADH